MNNLWEKCQAWGRFVGKVVNVAIGVLCQRVLGRWSVLVARRPAEGVLAGYWEFPGGKIESGEEPQEALRREFQEELDLVVKVEGALRVVEHHYGHGHVRLHPFWCSLESGRPRNLQVVEHRWVWPQELADFDLPAANGPLVEEVVEVLAGKV